MAVQKVTGGEINTRENFTKPSEETGFDDVMSLCEMGSESDASFPDIRFARPSRFGDPENGTSSKPPNLDSSYCIFCLL
jgi:hypothetical protein